MGQIEGRIKRRSLDGYATDKGSQHDNCYFRALVDEVQRRKRLADDRPNCAVAVRDAGNDAIHNLKRFGLRWGNRLGEIPLNSRRVLLDLYADAAPV